MSVQARNNTTVLHPHASAKAVSAAGETSTAVAPREPALDTVLSAVLYLMSRYASHPDADLAEAICFHLELLARREDTPEESLGRAARRLWPLWRGIGMDCPAVVRLHQVGGEARLA
jgi:hypothetical protein